MKVEITWRQDIPFPQVKNAFKNKQNKIMSEDDGRNQEYDQKGKPLVTWTCSGNTIKVIKKDHLLQ